jgi:3-hydroxyisobutyrate dehydrogenase-like beta-hydroxyacid dehydrogenase
MSNSASAALPAAVLAFVGVGAMGEGMCRNLARKSAHRVIAVDLDPANLQRLECDGVQAGTLARVRDTARTVFLSLPSIHQVEQVCIDGPDPLAVRGGSVRTIVDMSTSDVARTRKLAERLAGLGITLIDAPVARSREAAHNGTLLITVGGERDDVERVRYLLDCMGSDIVHCGAVGAGQAAKILNNMVVMVTSSLLAETVAIGEAAGMNKQQLVDVLQLGSADSFVLRVIGEKYLAKNDFPEKLFSAAYALKDLRLALDIASSCGIDARLAAQSADRLQHIVQAGQGQRYHPIVYRLIAGRDVSA